jgi:hypothetical protein
MSLPQELKSGKLQPISSFQSALLVNAADPETSKYFVERYTIRWAFRIHPGVPSRTLIRAFDKLTARHDSLRLRFVDCQNGWQAEILQKHPRGLIIEDLSTLDVEAQNETICTRALEPLTAFSSAMFEMILFKCGKAGDVVLTRAQHAIIDGYGVVILIEDLLKIVMNMPLGPDAPTHEDFIIERCQKLREGAEEKAAFWRAHFLPPPAELNIGRKAKGLPAISSRSIGQTLELGQLLTPAQSTRLEQISKRTGVNAFSYLHAAFCETICSIAGQTEVLVNSVVGRMDASMMRFVGAALYPIGVNYRCNSNDIEERARWVSGAIKKACESCPNEAFELDGPITNALSEAGTTWFRFVVHIPTARARVANSPFARLFDDVNAGKVSLGFASLERFDLPGETATDCELQLSVTQVDGSPNAALVADSAAYTSDDLLAISEGIISRLGLSDLDEKKRLYGEFRCRTEGSQAK